MVKLIPLLCICSETSWGNLWPNWAGDAGEKEKKGSLVNRKESSNRKDIYKAAFGYCSVWKEFVKMAIYESLNGLINHNFMPSQSEAMKIWCFGTLRRY